jgi:hypothetical protein
VRIGSHGRARAQFGRDVSVCANARIVCV